MLPDTLALHSSAHAYLTPESLIHESYKRMPIHSLTNECQERLLFLRDGLTEMGEDLLLANADAMFPGLQQRVESGNIVNDDFFLLHNMTLSILAFTSFLPKLKP